MLGLAGCAPAPQPIPFTLDAGGVQLTDSPLRIDFGRTEDSTIAAMTRLMAAPPVDTGACSTTRFARWAGGPTLYFRDGDFIRWSAPGAGVDCSEPPE